MSIRRIGAGARMSQAVVHGDTVYLAGQVAAQTSGADVAEQTRQILAAIDKLLAEAGTDKTRLLSATIYLADISTFAEMNAVWDAWVARARRRRAPRWRRSSPRPPTGSRSPASRPRLEASEGEDPCAR